MCQALTQFSTAPLSCTIFVCFFKPAGETHTEPHYIFHLYPCKELLKVRQTESGFQVTTPLMDLLWFFTYYCCCLSSTALASFYVTAINVQGSLWLSKNTDERGCDIIIQNQSQTFNTLGWNEISALSISVICTLAQPSKEYFPLYFFIALSKFSFPKKFTITHFQTYHDLYYWKRSSVSINLQSLEAA